MESKQHGTKQSMGHWRNQRENLNLKIPGDKWKWKHNDSKSISTGTSLVVQWLRICLPMQGTQVWALVREDPTCHGATNPMHHNYWACTLEHTSHNYWARVPQLLKPAHLQPMLRNKRGHRNKTTHRTKSSPHSRQLEKAHVQQRRPNAAKNE